MIFSKQTFVASFPRKIFRSIFISVLILSATPSPAQLNPGNVAAYTEKNGLPGTEVFKIIVDQFGYIWVGTINGLARFDGYTFKRFYENPNDPGSIK
jgi:ligand-binding sensor domain-containing protein